MTDARLTFLWLADVIFLLHLFGLGRILDNHDDLALVVEPDVAVAEQVHLELVLARLRRCLELHLQRLHLECRLSSLVYDLLVECRVRERRYGDLALTCVGQE